MKRKSTYKELEQRVIQLENASLERKPAEEALRESEEKLRTFMDSVADFFAVTDKNENLIYVNRSMAEALGYAKEEIIGMHITEIISEESMANFEPELKELVEKGKLSIEAKWLRRNGEKVHGELNVYAMYDRDGSYAGSRGVFRDITERKRAERALAESEERLRTLFELAPDGYYLNDLKGNFIDGNRAAEDIIGYSREELIGKNFLKLNLLPKEEIPKAAGLLAKNAIGKPTGPDEFALIRKDGTHVTVEIRTFPTKIKGKKVVLGIARDITKRKRVEGALQRAHDNLEMRVEERAAQLVKANEQLKQEIEERKRVEWALRESEERHRAVLEASPDPIVVYDMEGKVIYLNPAFTRVFGWALDQLLGKKVDYVPEENWPETQMMIDKVLAGESFSGIQSRRYTKRRDVLDVSISVATYLDRDGVPSGSVHTLRDITERKRLEAQLQQVQRLESIGTLAGGIAHDFNNLLMGIQGNISLMLMDMDAAHPYYERSKNIEKQIRSGARLTSHLLGCARKGKYEIKTLDLNAAVEGTADTFGRTKKEITIQRELAKGLFPIEADPAQIEQVLFNLFVNAADAMPGGGRLILKTTNVTHKDMKGKLYKPKPGNYALLTVKDTGTGMHKETMERIFDPFFTTKEMGRGTGLGLASAYGIIKAHSGYIDVVSKKGLGATFSIYLPASGKQVQRVVRTEEQFAEGTGTVLLVDDEKIILEVGQELLESMGYRVLTAKEGKEAIKLYKENQDDIDIVVLDLVMPVMGGGEAYDRMKKVNRDIKVLLSSGFSIDGEASEILERGCDGFIQKPFTMKELSEKIGEILDRA